MKIEGTETLYELDKEPSDTIEGLRSSFADIYEGYVPQTFV